MKFISAILAVIILTLSFSPCADRAMAAKSEHKASNFHQNHEEHNHHSDACSPLCVCSCCGTVLAHIEAETVFEIPFIEINSSENTIFKQRLPSDIYFSIWEPPKIA